MKSLLCFWFSLVFFWFELNRSTAFKTSKKLNALDIPYGFLLAKDFGMAERGVIELGYDVSFTNPLAFASSSATVAYVLLLVMTEQQRVNWYGELDDDDLEEIQDNISNLCTQPSAFRRHLPAGTSGNFTIPITRSLGDNRYSVAILQCRSFSTANDASMAAVDVYVTAELKNARPPANGNDDEYSQLAIEQVMLTRVFEGELILYFLLIAGLCGQMYLANGYRLRIHWLFMCCLVSTTVHIFVKYYEYYYFNKFGTVAPGVKIGGNFTELISEIFVIVTLLLLSLGWSVVRSMVSSKERTMITTSISVWSIFGIGAAACIKENDATCEALSLVAFVLRSMILLAIIIAMNFTVTQLRSMLYHTPWVPSTPIQHARTKQYQIFRLIFIVYLLMPTAFLLIEVTTLTWREEWLVTLFNDVLVVLMFVHVGVTFSPLQEPLLTRAFDGSLSAAIAARVPGAGAAAGAGGGGGTGPNAHNE